jgi:hypothetical protein
MVGQLTDTPLFFFHLSRFFPIVPERSIPSVDIAPLLAPFAALHSSSVGEQKDAANTVKAQSI